MLSAGAWLAAGLPLGRPVAVAAEHHPPVVVVAPQGPADAVFIWRRDACEKIDTPDAPARAFRDAAGMIHLIAAHYVAREMIGRTLDQVRHRCDVAFASALGRQYESHRNHEWLSGLYTADGITVHALVHNEFHGADYPGLCPLAGTYDCWWNSVTYAVSTDRGYHFHDSAIGNHVVAALPYPYSGARSEPAGYFAPSNIVTMDGQFYAMVKATAYRSQQAGSCLIRTATLDQAGAWRAWDGDGFTVSLSEGGPSGGDGLTASHVCAPVANVSLGDVGGIARDETTGAFVAVMVAMLPDDAGRRVCGFWATASFDLTDWSSPSLVAADPAGASTCDPASDGYPSILDPDSKQRNFDTFGSTPYLYFVRSNLADPPYDRQLMRQRVTISIRTDPPAGR